MKLLRRFCAEHVNILLDRMESHPEEFCKSLHITGRMFEGKWDFVLSAGEFTKIEKHLIKRKIKELKRNATHQQILMTILYGEEEPKPPINFSTTGRFTTPEHIESIVKNWATD